jgi:hypothetical protein
MARFQPLSVRWPLSAKPIAMAREMPTPIPMTMLSAATPTTAATATRTPESSRSILPSARLDRSAYTSQEFGMRGRRFIFSTLAAGI